ncbi:MAG: hypothetical protein ABIJ57_13450 [Pseudomonadota bacterium]
MDLFKRMAYRFLRAAVAMAVPLAIQALQESTDPTIMLIAPVLMAIGKALRAKFGWTWLPV